MSRYRVYAKTIFELEVNNEDEIENIINNGFDLGELKITSVRKILHTKCGTCEKELLNRTASAKFCNDICRATYNNQRYKQNKEHKIEN